MSPSFTPTTVNIHIPLCLKRRGGRKMIVTPEGHTLAPALAPKREPDAPLIKALLRAWQWQKDIESGKAQSMEAIAERHNVDTATVSRLMRLNFLAPDLKLAILEGTQPKALLLQDLIRKVWPEDWEGQRAFFQGYTSSKFSE
ncbi:MAG: hypothetical protein ACKO43_06570 [Alphaproteobacteria bacterium]